MKIVFVTQSIGLGGASKMLCFIAESLAQRGHEIHIINLKSTIVNVPNERVLSDKINYHIVKDSNKKGLRRFEQIKQIAKISKHIKADLLVGFTLFPNFMVSIVGNLLRIPSIMSERGDPKWTFNGGVISKLFLTVINRCTGGVFQTEGAKHLYGKRLKKNGVVIANPIFIEGDIPVVNQGEREKSVVSVGRLDNYQKRYDVMLDTFAKFSKKHPEYILKLYGKGMDEEKIALWVKEKGLEDKVKFMGLTTKPMEDTARDGMFLITSDFEGISNSLLEAMAVGLPCVSTDHTPGGARLLITDHENGLLAPVEDSERLAAALCEFAENPELAEICGNNAKDVVNRFAPEKIINMWENYCIKIAGVKS